MSFKALALLLLVFFGCPVATSTAPVLTDLSEKSLGLFLGGVLRYWMMVSVYAFQVIVQGLESWGL